MSRCSSRALAACLFGVSLAACSSGNPSFTGGPSSRTAADATDRTFVPGAAHASNAEISDAQLALTISKNQSVLAFAQKMITDHTGENQALDPIGDMLGLPPPTNVLPAMQAIHNQLATLSGSAFDAAYINSEVLAHQNNLDNNYIPELQTGSSSAVVGYANTYDPQIQEHLSLAQNIKAQNGF